MKKALLFFAHSVTAALLAATACGQQLKQERSGFSATSGDITLQVTALRDDVVRVRVWKGSNVPEDASWAVLPAARTSSVPVQARADGLETKALRVQVTPDLRLTVSDLAGNILQQDTAPVSWQGTRFELKKKDTPDDHFFGLGDKPGPLDRQGQSFRMWNTDAFGWQESTDPIYKSIPFFINLNHGRALGVYLDNTFKSEFDFGRTDDQTYSFGSSDGPCDYYLLYGPTPKQVVTAWAWLTGPTPLPPLWALGFQQSRYSYFPASQLREVADRLRKDRIPTDVLWMDIDYQEKNRPFTVDQQAFPDFAGMVKDLARENFKLVLITDLHIAQLPNAGYAPYDSGVAGDHFVKNPDGSMYVGKVWPGASVFPDFTREQTRRWWGTLYREFVQDGVAGFWNDMNEPAVFTYPSKTMPDTVQHRIDEPGFRKRTATHLEVHNIFGMQNSRATYEGQLALRPNERPFVMTRASFAGGHRYSTTWTGDNSSTWNHLRMSVPQIVNLGLSGFSLSGADVGGFAGSPPADLLTKWIEVAAFQPIDRDHSAKGTRMHEVWVDGPDQETIRRKYIEERYRLMPYLYTVAEETSRTGLPFNRPLFLEFPQASPDGGFGASEFMVGGRLMIAPNPSPEEVGPYTVDLPPGTWYSYWTGERYTKRSAATAVDAEQRDLLLAQKPLLVTPKLEELPVYVRGGAILPIAPLTQSTAEVPQGPLTLRVYPLADGMTVPGETCAGEVYADDGHTFNYRGGDYARVKVTCSAGQNGEMQVEIARQEGRFKPWWHSYRVELVGWTPAPNASTVAGKPVQPTQVNGIWGVEVTATSSNLVVELR